VAQPGFGSDPIRLLEEFLHCRFIFRRWQALRAVVGLLGERAVLAVEARIGEIELRAVLRQQTV